MLIEKAKRLVSKHRIREDYEAAIGIMEALQKWYPADSGNPEDEALARWCLSEIAWTQFLPMQELPTALETYRIIIEKWPTTDEAKMAYYYTGVIWRSMREWRREGEHGPQPPEILQEKIDSKAAFQKAIEGWPESVEAKFARSEIEVLDHIINVESKIPFPPALPPGAVPR